MPHQKSIPSRKPLQNSMFHPGSQFSYETPPPHYSNGFQNDFVRRPEDAHHYAQNYYDHENGHNDDRWRRFSMTQQPQHRPKFDQTKSVKKVSSHESDEEAAATALLIAAGGPRRVDVEKQMEMSKAVNVQTMSDSIPHELNHACHVSVNSMDCQDGVSSTLPKNNGSEAEEGPSKSKPNSKTPSFPAILHEVLTDSKFSRSVLEWLPNGKSWRVLRWDDLANKVIPAHFPDLASKEAEECKKEKTATSDRINKFLQHIKRWGFVEMKEVGPEMGSYQHEFFIRIAPNLCKYMKIEKNLVDIAGVSADSNSNKNTNVVSPPREPSQPVVQHPSFDSPKSSQTSVLRNSTIVSLSPKKRKLEVGANDQEGKQSPLSQNSPRYPPFSDHDNTNISYRPGSPSYIYHRRIPSNDQPNYVTPSQAPPQFVGSRNTMSDVRSTENSFPSNYETAPSRRPRRIATTPRLQSNRGGAHASRLERRDETEKRAVSSPALATSRRSFPVSNRGKGRAHLSRTLSPHAIQEPEVSSRSRSNSGLRNNDVPTSNVCDQGIEGLEERGSIASFQRHRQDSTVTD